MRTPPSSTTRPASVSAWVTTNWRTLIVAVVALAGGMMPDLWPLLRVDAQSATNFHPAVVPDTIYRVEEAPYQPITLSAGFTVLPASDEGATAVVLPFPVSFYGTAYSKIDVGINGYIAFNPNLAQPVGIPITNCIPTWVLPGQVRGLFPYFGDLTTVASALNNNNGGSIRYQASGVTPNRIMTIEWVNVPWAYGPAPIPRASFQVQLFESGAPPMVHYVSVPNAPALSFRTPGAKTSYGSSQVFIGAIAGDTLAGEGNWTKVSCDPNGVARALKTDAYIESPGPATVTTLQFDTTDHYYLEQVTGRVSVSAGNQPVYGGTVDIWVNGFPFYSDIALPAAPPGASASELVFPYSTVASTSGITEIKAIYKPGDAPHYVGSFDEATLRLVDSIPTATALTLDPGKPVVGEPTTLIADVTSPGRVINNGVVRFFNNNNVIGSATVVNGHAMWSAVLPSGLQQLRADFEPSTNGFYSLMLPSSASLTVTVGGATSLTVQPFVLSNEWLVAQVNVPASAGGSVAFSLDGQSVAESPLYPAPGNVSLAVVPAPPMVYPFVGPPPPSSNFSVSAEYSGSPDAPSGSNSLVVRFNRPTENTSTTAVVPSSTTGGMLLTATVTTAGDRTGQVLFLVDGKPVGLATASAAGVATVTVPGMFVTDPHTIRASFLGKLVSPSLSSLTRPSSGTAVTSGFVKKTTTTSLTVDIGTRVGQPVWNVRATVAGAGNTTPDSGLITLRNGTTVLGTARVSEGKALVTFTSAVPANELPGGTVLFADLKVTYEGNDLFNTSVSASTKVTGFKTITTAAAYAPTTVPPTAPDYRMFNASVKMVTYTNLPEEANFGGSLQVRDGQGGTLMNDTSLDTWLSGSPTAIMDIPDPKAMTLITYSGDVRPLAAGQVVALLPSFVYLQHPNAQSRANVGTYEWINLSMPIQANPICDDCYQYLTAQPETGQIPWNIRFLNKEYNHVYVGNNGVVSFNGGVSAYVGQCPPTNLAFPLLAGFWADLDTRGTGSGLNTFQVVGTAPHRIAVFQWEEVGYYNLMMDKLTSLQIHLFEDNRPPRTVIRKGLVVIGTAPQSVGPSIAVDYGDGAHADVVQCSATGFKEHLNVAYDFELALTTPTLKLTSSVAQPTVGQPFTLTGKLTSGVVPDGTVKLNRTYAPTNVTTTVLSAPVPESGEVFATEVLAFAGNYTYTLQFIAKPGDPFANASTSINLNVITAPTTFVVAQANPSTMIYGQSGNVTANVVTASGGLPVTTGAVLFTFNSQATAKTLNASNLAVLPITPPRAGAFSAVAQHFPEFGTTPSPDARAVVTVQKRPALAIASNQTVPYGVWHLPGTVTIAPVPGNPNSGLVFGDTVANLTPQLVQTHRTPTSAVGTYPAIPVITPQLNYILTPVNGSVTVTQAGLTVVAPNASGVYGTIPPVNLVPSSYVGFVGNDSASVLDVKPVVSVNATSTSPVGTYPITVCCGSDNNYALGYVSGSYVVTPRTLTITANSTSRIYGAAQPLFTAAYSGFVNGDNAAGLDVLPTIFSNTSPTTPIGTYPIVVSGGSDNNYLFNPVNGTLTIDRASLLVTADNLAMVYGGPVPAFTSTFTGFMNGETESVLTAPVIYSSPVSAISPIGSYSITPSNAKAANYTVAFAPGSINVTKRPLTLVVDSKSRVYGAANPTLTGTLTNVFEKDSITASYATTATAASPIGSYPITGSLVDPLGQLPNYTSSITNGTLSVTSANATATAPTLTRVYGQSNPALSVTLSGFVAGDGITATASTTATAASPVGTYPVTITLNDPLSRLGNYHVATIEGSLTVTAATLTVTTDNASRSYGGANPIFTGTITGVSAGDNITVSYASNATAASPVGTYAIVPTLNDPNSVLTNYTMTAGLGTLTVTAIPLQVTADSAAREYGAANPPFTGSVTGVKNGDGITATFFSNTSPSTPIGAYPIVSTLNDPSGKLSNYTVSQTNGTLTIGKAALTVTANDQSRTYGAANPSFTGSVTGVRNGDAITASFFSNVSPTTPVGTYPIVSTLSDPAGVLANYSVTTNDGTLTIKKAALTITADAKTKIYGAALPTLSASYSGFVNGETFAVLDTPVSLSTAATAASPVGSYPITASAAADQNYAIAFVDGSLSVSAASLTITAENKAMTYGGTLPAFTAAYSGFVNGDTFASLATPVTLTTSATSASPTGSYAITAAGATSANYEIAFVAGSLTINRAALTITANDATKTYGSALPAFSASYAGFVNGDTFASLDTPVALATAATAASPVGAYPITASSATDDNYDIAFVTGSLSVTKATLTITADAKTKVYGAALPSLTASYDGFVNGDTAASLDTPVSLTTTGTPASAVGTYPITAAGAADHNYTIAFTNGLLSVTPATLTITAQDASMIYGGAVPSFTASYSGFVNGDTFASLATPVTLATAATSASPAGSYAITAAGATSANYDIAFASGTLTINRATLTISADDQSKVYGAALPALSASYAGFVNGDTAASLDTQVSLTTTATSASAVGTYPITAAGAADANYTIAYDAGTLDVTKAALTITAGDQLKMYGGMLDPGILVAHYDGFVNGDDQTDLTTPVQFIAPTDVRTVVGEYAIGVYGATSPNYAITFVTGVLTVAPAPLTITADSKSKAYGGAMPELTASYAGLVAFDDSGVLTTPVSLTTTATAASSVGTYAITASGAAAHNYEITFVHGSLTVTRAALSIRADDKSKTYGASMPALTASYAGLVNGDSAASLDTQVSLSTTGTAASAVGTYPITASAAADHNYDVTFVGGTLDVSRAALTITADDKSKTYGASMPALTASYHGFVNGDEASNLATPVALSTVATAASNVGSYAITASAATSPNYTISFVPGTLAVNRAALTITADHKSKIYGAAMPALTATYDGFVNGDDEWKLATPVALATTASATSAVGGYPITASGAADPNYTITMVNGSFTVTPAVLTITANNAAKVYGAALPNFTASYSGFVNGDDAADLATPVSLTTSATSASAVGTYVIDADGATSPNYTVGFASGTLTINRAALTITADGKSKVYGAAMPALTASYDGFVNNDTAANLDAQVNLVTAATAASAVGSYAITASGAADHNYDITLVNGSINVTRAALTVRADDQAKIYGAAMPALTASYTGFVNGDDAGDLTAAVSLATAAEASSAVGNYGITASAAASPNYDITFAAGTLTINRAALTIAADHKSKVYGAAMPSLTATYTGFVNGDHAGSLDTAVSLATGATDSSIAGSYAITATAAADANYSITLVDNTIDVTRAALTVTANSASKIYGAVLPAFTASYAGFVNGDDASALDAAVTFTSAATAASSTGSYAITPGSAADHNYTISFVNGSLTVTPAALTITADSATKIYGAALPAFTASYAGFVNGDGPASLDAPASFATAATAASNVGSYAITASGAADANYTIGYAAGSLTVTPASLTISADNKNKVYGAANPALTASYSGFVNGDAVASLNPAVSLTTAATTATAAGSYAITASAAANPNYAITFVPGTLTITKAILTVKANDVTKLLGAPLPAFTASYTGFLNGDTPSMLGGTLAFATSATAASGPGTYTVTPSGLTSANYTLQFATGTLTITYNVCLKSDGTKPAGGSERILLQLCNASGAAAGPSNLTLTAINIVTPAGATVATPVGVGQNANGLFNYGSIGQGQQGYIFHLRTQSLPAGSYDLVFSVSGDPQTHTARFAVR